MIVVKTSRNILISIVLLTSIILTTIVYSAFSTQLQIGGDAIVRSDNDIRITNVKILEKTNGAFETYSNKYTRNTTSQFVSLLPNSSITYQVTITNKSNIDYVIYDYEDDNSNNNISYTINDLSKEDIIYSNTSQIFNIKFTNLSQEEQNTTLLIKYLFEENKIYTITYDLDGGQVNNPTFYTKYTDTFTLNNPIKEGYTFKGWEDEQSELYCDINQIYFDDNNLLYKFVNANLDNNFSYFKILLYSLDGQYLKWIVGNSVVGNNKGKYVHNLESGYYVIKYGANGDKSDSMLNCKIFLENGSTYIYEWNMKSFNTKEVIINNLKFYRENESTTGIPIKIITKYSIGNRNLKAIWEEN